jgi:hypothetical protein
VRVTRPDSPADPVATGIGRLGEPEQHDGAALQRLDRLDGDRSVGALHREPLLDRLGRLREREADLTHRRRHRREVLRIRGSEVGVGAGGSRPDEEHDHSAGQQDDESQQ